MSAGIAPALNWMEAELKAKYNSKSQRLRRTGEHDINVLSHIARLTKAGYGVESHPPHANFVIEHWVDKSVNIVNTPCTDAHDGKNDGEDEEELDPAEAKTDSAPAADLHRGQNR